MKMFNKVAIIGVGLIGGSLGLAIKKKKLAKEVIGVTSRKASLSAAKARGAIHKGTLNFKHAVKDADLVIVATPVKMIPGIIRIISPSLKKGCIVTDVGSTKQEIVTKIEKQLPKNIYFVGGHPLAGREKRGVSAARAGLFENTICILTPTPKTNQNALAKTKRFWKELGASSVSLLPSEHDKILSQVSHLPHLVVAALVSSVDPKSLKFASTGFKDTTRIAAGDAVIWRDVCLSNKKAIIKAIDKFTSNLSGLRKSIAKGDKQALARSFKRAKKLRDSLD